MYLDFCNELRFADQRAHLARTVIESEYCSHDHVFVATISIICRFENPVAVTQRWSLQSTSTCDGGMDCDVDSASTRTLNRGSSQARDRNEDHMPSLSPDGLFLRSVTCCGNGQRCNSDAHCAAHGFRRRLPGSFKHHQNTSDKACQSEKRADIQEHVDET